MQFLYPNQELHCVYMVAMVFQKDNDCGLFASAYAYELSLKRDPAKIKILCSIIIICM